MESPKEQSECSLIEVTSENIVDKFCCNNYTYNDQQLQTSIFTNLGRYCDTEEFADITIMVNDRRYRCHRVVLASSCRYFRALFQHQPNHDLIHLNDITCMGFSALRRYMYTGVVSLRYDNVSEILQAADFMQYRELVDTCAAMLLQHINVKNCLRIFHLADIHSCRDLYHSAKQYCLAHFQNIIWTRDFIRLPWVRLSELLSHEYCSVDSECDILVALSRWLSSQTFIDGTLEGKTIDEILSLCNLNLIDDKDIKMCSENFSILNLSSKFKKRIEKPIPCDARILHRVVQGRLKEVVVVIVKRPCANQEAWPAPRQVVQQVLYYHPAESLWLVLTELPCEDRDLYGACALNNNIFVTGGVINVNDLSVHSVVTNEVWKYTTAQNEWNEMAPMLKSRKNHGTAVLHEKLYVIGGAGRDLHHLRRDGEVYDSQLDQWTLLPELLDVGGIGNPAVVALNGLLYVIGGICSDLRPAPDVKLRQCLAAQNYNPHTAEWTRLDDLTDAIKTMNLKPGGNECLSYLGFIIFVDEDPYSAQKKPRTLKLYDLLTRQVHDFIEYNYNRFGGYTMYRDEIVHTGGIREGFYAQNLVYSCDLSRTCPEWTMWTPMPVRSSHHACFTLFMPLQTAYSGAAHFGTAHSNAAYSGAAHSSAAHSGAAHSDAAHSDAAHSDAAHSGAVTVECDVTGPSSSAELDVT